MPAFVALVLQYGPALIQAGINLAPLLSTAADIASTGREPTDAEWAMLHSNEDELLAELSEAAKKAQQEINPTAPS